MVCCISKVLLFGDIVWYSVSVWYGAVMSCFDVLAWSHVVLFSDVTWYGVSEWCGLTVWGCLAILFALLWHSRVVY